MEERPTEVEVSVVMPCLNEADTLAVCIAKARRALAEHGIAGEIIVADNGSTDGSAAIAEAAGARVVHVAARGYGHALMGGIAAARGRFVIMGDADDSYDFLEIPKFVEKLREGYELVQGCRLPGGGGRVLPGAMPWSHRWIGNPLFSWLARHWFGAKVHDAYCGLRGFVRGLESRLDLRCAGMEFATEMIIKASLRGVKMTEVPITLHPDGRKVHAPHLRTLRDGWRTLRFYLMYSPKWLFSAPGFALIALGLLGYAVALPGLHFGRVRIEGHTLLYASIAILCGYQAVLFGLFTKAFAENTGLVPPDPRLKRWVELLTLERGLAAGAGALLAGLALLAWGVLFWKSRGFGDLDYAFTLRRVIPGATLTLLGFQTMLASFFLGILGLSRR